MALPNPDMAAASPGAPRAHGRSYLRRQPEHSLVHPLVAAEADGVRAAVYRASEHGRGLPRHVDKELDALLDCGLLHRGFARVVCRERSPRAGLADATWRALRAEEVVRMT